MHIDVTIIQDQYVTVAAAQLDEEVLIGSAKRHPTDEHDPLTGQVLALSRLFDQMSDHFQTAFKILTEAPDPTLSPVSVGEFDFYNRHGVPPEEVG